MPKVAHLNDRDDDVADRTEPKSDRAPQAARSARAEQPQVDGANGAPGDSVLEILGEQTHHCLEVAAALGRARSLAEVTQLQTAFIGESFGRIGRLNERYLILLRSGMPSLTAGRRH